MYLYKQHYLPIFNFEHIQKLKSPKPQEIHMKRRSHASTQATSKQAKSSQKKPHLINPKTKYPKSHHQKSNKIIKPFQEDYLMINGNIYKANTPTQRTQVNYFVNRIKRQAVNSININTNTLQSSKYPYQQQKSLSIKQSQANAQQLDIQSLIKYLPTQQKLSLMRQLQQQLGTTPQFNTTTSPSLQNLKQSQQKDQNEQKYKSLNQNLTNLQHQLHSKRELQLQKINQSFYNGNLTASQRKYQIIQLDKTKNKKIKIINCTRNLFSTLLHNQLQTPFFKDYHIEEAMKQLDCFYDHDNNSTSEQSLPYTKNKNIQTNNHNTDATHLTLNLSNPHQISPQNPTISLQNPIPKPQQSKNQPPQKYQQPNSLNNQQQNPNININILNNKPFPLNQQLLLQHDKSFQNQNHSQKPIQSKIPTIINPPPPTHQISQIQTDDQFQCSQQTLPRRLRIPLLLTKQKIQEIQQQKKNKSKIKTKNFIDQKIAFQMSQITIPGKQNHFTTLGDINQYIVSLYQYIIKTDIQRVVQRLNFPYGKPISDKLYYLQQSGKIDELQYYSVLDETHFNGFNIEMALTVRRLSDDEKIHHKAVFDSFNTNLNAYRPYYELEGDVYPWAVSQKGITFYEITEQNIEQVFEKTKIKVLQYSSSLCGILPFDIDNNENPQLIKQKNNQFFQKQQRISIAQQFQKWNVILVDYDAMTRLSISTQIYLKQITNFCQQLFDLSQINHNN